MRDNNGTLCLIKILKKVSGFARSFSSIGVDWAQQFFGSLFRLPLSSRCLLFAITIQKHPIIHSIIHDFLILTKRIPIIKRERERERERR